MRHSRCTRSRTTLTALVLLLLCCVVIAATATVAYSPISDYTISPRQLQDEEEEGATTTADSAKDEDEVIDDKDEAALMADDNLEEEYQFDDASLMEDHFDSQGFPSSSETTTNNYNFPGTEKVEKVPEIVYDDFDAIAPGDPARNEGGGVESDGSGMMTEEVVDVEEKAKELLQEAAEEETNESGGTSTKPVPLKTYSTDKQKKWVAHGAIGTIIFGLLVPSAISSAFFRDLIPGYWIYVHVFLNVTTFAMTFFTVGIAFATLNGMGDASEGHLKEVHHIVGLLLLLLVSFQTANGFLRPPREFITDDIDDPTPGAIHRSNSKSLTTRTIWYLTHAGSGLLIFALGTYQVHSGMGLFSKRFGSTDWGSVYLGYIFVVVIVITVGKIWSKVRDRKSKRNSFEMQTSMRGFNFNDDDSSDLGELNFRQV
jgi:hypothetical protein